jgi:hypothetical protein
MAGVRGALFLRNKDVHLLTPTFSPSGARGRNGASRAMKVTSMNCEKRSLCMKRLDITSGIGDSLLP